MLVEANLRTLEIDPTRTAVLVIDMQNDFGSKGGMFYRAGVDISGIQRVVKPTARVIAAARAAAIKIIYLKMGFQADLSDAGPPDSPNRVSHDRMRVGEIVRAPDGSESRILVRDTWNTNIIPELQPQRDDVVIWKTRYSGFYRTDLHDQLQRLNMKHLIVTGCTTSVCVESTVRDATFRDYTPVVLEDCCSEPIGQDMPTSNHDASLRVIQTLFGSVSSSEAFLQALAPLSAEVRA